MYKVIGIAGPAGSGKDTAAGFVQTKLARHTSYSFARPLKEAVKVLFGWDQKFIDNRDTKETVDPFWGFSPRQAMQWLGTEYGRELCGQDVWIKAADKYLETVTGAQTPTFEDVPGIGFVEMEVLPALGLIVSDVRFENEASWVRKNGGLVIHLRREEADEVAAHKSEAGVGIHPDDAFINNNEGVDVLYEKLEAILAGQSKGDKPVGVTDPGDLAFMVTNAQPAKKTLWQRFKSWCWELVLLISYT
jgi:hypothetical protein